MVQTIFYLHGFLSSPTGPKAALLSEECAKRGISFVAPDMNEEPLILYEKLKKELKGKDPASFGLIGSSLGGFYATRLASQFGCKTVLINPATAPWLTIKNFLGKQLTRDGKVVVVKEEYGAELQSLYSDVVKYPERMLLVLSLADEVLNWKETEKRFSMVKTLKLPNEDHAVSGFSKIVSQVVDYFVPQKG